MMIIKIALFRGFGVEAMLERNIRSWSFHDPIANEKLGYDKNGKQSCLLF